MDYELVLENQYDRIARDLDVNEIRPYIIDLLTNELPDREVQDILNSEDDEPTRAKRFLDTLKTTKFQSKIKNFVAQLKALYPHLEKDFNDDLQKIKSIDELPTTKKHIRRVKKVKEIVDHFRVNTAFVILHGFSGTGKTNLAVEAAMYFALQRSVYWVNAGGSTGSQLKVLRMLLSRVQPKQEDPDSQSDPDQLVRKLKELLTADDLVILDNVTIEVDLRVFTTLPPQFLITTTDTGIMEYLDSPEKIDMSQGFTKEESLELFSKVVNKSVDSLPQCVQDVHKYFKGYPLAVTLIASQLAHCNESQWAQYCEVLDDGDMSSRRRSSDGFRLPVDSTIHKCIQSLSPENQFYYKKLAIFKDNVFLTTETLQVLWDCFNDVHKVRKILNELEDKSMVIKNWKVAFETDVYEVHSTVLSFLRRQQSEEDIKKIHQNFVNNYARLYNGKVSDIVDDHYIYYYMIYHITSAGYLDQFRTQLFSLDYILAKLVACGPNDMAEDLKIYKEDLETAGFDNRRLEETSEFSEKFGWDIYHTKVKDLQFFLQMPENSLLFKEAMERCKASNTLVLKSKWLTPGMSKTKEYPFPSLVKKLYCLEHNEILCEKGPNDKPTIVLFKLGDVKETVIAEGSILCVSIENGNVLYKDKRSAFLKQVGGGRTPDATRQLNGDRSFFRAASLGTKIPAFEDIIIAAFSQSGDKIVFASNAEKGIYDLEVGTFKYVSKSGDAPIPTPYLCCFCSVQNSEIFMFATMERKIYFYQTSDLVLITDWKLSSIIVDITPIPKQHQLLVLSESSVNIIFWEHGPQKQWSASNQSLTLGNLKSDVIYDGPKKCLKSFATDRWITIATSDGCLVKPNGRTKDEAFFDVGYGEVAALDISENTLTVITTRGRPCKESCVGGEEERRITVYENLDLERNRHRPRLTDACQLWPIQKGYLLAMVEPNKAVFYHDKHQIYEAKISHPLTVDMSQMGDISVVGDALGNIHYMLPFKKRLVGKVTPSKKKVDFLKINSTGQYIVAGCMDSESPSICIIRSRVVLRMDICLYPIFDCFFEEESMSSKGPLISPDPKVKIILLFKNGAHAVYDCTSDKYRLGYVYDQTWNVTCAAYQNKTLIKATDSILHVIQFEKDDTDKEKEDTDKEKQDPHTKQDIHKSKDFEHRITSCCIEPLESVSAADPTKPWVALAFATDDRRFQIAVCSKDINELRRIYLDYAQEEIRQVVFSKTQMILMARCDWLCFWDMSGESNTTCAKAVGSTLHPVWKTYPVHLDKQKLVARFKLQLEVLSFLPSDDFGTFAVVHKKGDRRLLHVVDYDNLESLPRNGSFPSLQLTLKSKNGSL